MMKPILFNTDMVRAILDGRKTVTRRVVKFLDGRNPTWTGYIPDGAVLYGSNNIPAAKAPYRPGDILYVREAWRPHAAWSGSCIGCEIEYKAGGENLIINDSIIAVPETVTPWRPSIHMPREAARIFLRVTDVRVERLQEINMFGILHEGVVPVSIKGGDWEQWQNDYMKPAWDSTIKPADRERYGWAANPWTWVVEFERCEKPEEGNERG